MSLMKRFACFATLLSFVAVNGAYALISDINSAVIQPRIFNDVPAATFTSVNNYPSLISLDEQGVSAPTGFANRDTWQFSANGSTGYLFQNDDFFQVSMTLTLTGDPISPRKEAGFLLDTIGGQGQFIVNTDAHEVVVFGGPLPFYIFPITYNSGDAITLGMTYFLDGNGKRAIIYSANGVDSPTLEFTNLEQGIMIGNTTLGGYLQVVNNTSNPDNGGMAVFQDTSIVPYGTVPISTVPEPSTFLLLGAGLAGIGFLRRRAKM